MHRIEGLYDGFAADRSLAELVSCYRTCVAAFVPRQRLRVVRVTAQTAVES